MSNFEYIDLSKDDTIKQLQQENEQLKKDVELWEDTHKHHLNIYHNLYDDYCKLKEELKDIKLGKPVPAGITILKKMELSKSFEKQLRHEICEDIMNKIDEKFNCCGYIEDIKFEDFKKIILDQIEGKTDEK